MEKAPGVYHHVFLLSDQIETVLLSHSTSQQPQVITSSRDAQFIGGGDR